MAPPQFNDLGKKSRDLFKKSFDYKNQVKVVTKADGVKLESGGVYGKDLVGHTKANWSSTFLGSVEVEAHSSGLAKGKFKKSNVADGVDVTVSGSACGGLNVEATYAKDFLSMSAKGCHNFNKPCTNLTASAVVGFEGVSLGGVVKVDGKGSPKDYNVGAEYTKKDLTASLVTSNKGDDITVSFWQNYNPSTSLGASMLVKPESGSRLFTFGTQYALDASTSLKLKADSAGVVGTSVTHVLANPAMKFGVCAEFDATNTDVFAAQKFGVALNFGDF